MLGEMAYACSSYRKCFCACVRGVCVSRWHVVKLDRRVVLCLASCLLLLLRSGGYASEPFCFGCRFRLWHRP